MQYIKNRLLEGLPLSIFLIYSSIIESKLTDSWKEPIIAGGVLASILIAVHIIKGIEMNRVFLGINIYFISGLIIFALNLIWLGEIYAKLMASGLIAWIAIVGLLLTLFSRSGYIGVKSPNKKAVYISSINLLAITLLAFFVSLQFQGNMVLSEIIPFCSIFFSYNLFRLYLSKKAEPISGKV